MSTPRVTVGVSELAKRLQETIFESRRPFPIQPTPIRTRCRPESDTPEHFVASDPGPWYNHVNLTAHDQGGHFIPWEIPDLWTQDLRRTFRGRR